MNVQAESVWDAENQLITTRLTGDVHVQDIRRWETGLHEALSHIEENGSFTLLVDLTGYELRDMAAHKAMRGIVPQLLATYGLRDALFDLYPEVEVTVTRTRGILCRAVANVHHDGDKMAEYERRLGRAHQRFFTNAHEARAWLLSLDRALKVVRHDRAFARMGKTMVCCRQVGV